MKITKEGNFLCQFSTLEEYEAEIKEREREWKEFHEEYMREKAVGKIKEDFSEAKNFSEEEEFPQADEQLVRWTLEELNRIDGIPNENEMTKEEVKELFSRYAEADGVDVDFYFSEEQETSENLENWKEIESKKIKSLEDVDKRRDKKRGKK